MQKEETVHNKQMIDTNIALDKQSENWRAKLYSFWLQ